jgi:hypothetical protein
MRREKISGALDRQIITAMIVSGDFLREVRDIYSSEYLSAPYAATVAEWCLSYYKKYGTAPARRIEDRFKRAIADSEIRDEATETLIGDFLSGLSRDYDAKGNDINVQFLLDEAERLFRKRNLSQLADEIKDALARSPDDAEDLIRQHKRVERAQAGGFDPLRDTRRFDAMFAAPQEPLIHFDGALGEMFNPMATREQLIGVMAPEKGRKSFFLAEIISRSIMARRNVALFECGDLSESQLLRRVYSSMLGVRIDDRFGDDRDFERRSEVDCVRNQLGLCRKDCRRSDVPLRARMEEPVPDELPEGYRTCTACEDDFIPCVGYCDKPKPPVMLREMVDRIADTTATHMGSHGIRFDVRANNTLTAEDMNNQLLRWKDREGFVPDVIVCDYADIMAQETGTRDERSSQNERWKWFRRMSQEWHALFVVATQTDALAYDKDSVNISNYSEDKRKYSHVTGMIALHTTAAERAARCMRASWLLGREMPSEWIGHEVVLCERLAVSRIHTGSFWRRQSRLGDEYRYKPKMVNGGIMDAAEEG